jgi:PAS domain S-box-containing protein
MNLRPGKTKLATSKRTSTRGHVVLLLIAFAVVTGGVTAALLLYLRGEAITSGQKVLTAFAELTEEQTTRTIQDVDQTLEIVEHRLASATRADTANEGAMRVELNDLLTSRPFLSAITVLDRHGRFLFRSEGGGKIGLDMSDRDYFIRHRDDPKAPFMLSAPIRGRSSKDWIIPATRTWRGATGDFDGVIIGSINPLYFAEIWTVDKAVQDQATALWRNDGIVLMRSPFNERTMGVVETTGVIFARIRAGSEEGTLRTVSLVDGQDRLIAYKRLKAYPALTLSVTQSTDRVLAGWRRLVRIIVSGWAFGMAAVACLALWLASVWDGRRALSDRYRALFNASPYPMIVVNRDTRRIDAVNNAAVEDYGWSSEEVLAMKADDLYLPEDMPAILARRKMGVLETRRGFTGRLHKKDGTILDVEMTQRPIEFDGHSALLATALDVTERNQANKVRAAMEDQLRQSQKMEAVGQLTGGIAHDFNNILHIIFANTDALVEEETLSGSVKGHLDQIAKAVERASGLTKQLLAFSRKQPLQPQLTDLNDLVTDTGKLLRRALGAEIEIESILSDGLCIANIDRAQLETALVNLCINARDAMPGGGRLLIETHNVTLNEDYVALNPDATAGPYAMLSVTDTGSGIPPETLRKVFEPFFTTKEVGKGTGLGLSMVYGFIKQSHGHVSITSEVGVGTKIKLYMPCSNGAADAADVRNDTPIPRGSERILVVEDEPQVRASVVQQLRGLGYSVSEAPDGGAGIAAFDAALRPYDLLLTDVVMPGLLNGKALAAEVVRRWPQTKVVFMSGFTETSSARHGQLDEGALLLSKPFRRVGLARIVRKALAGTGASSDAETATT